MENKTSLHEQLDALDRLIEAECFADALKLIASNEASRLLLPRELVTRGRAIQLAEATPELPLSDAKQAFQQALELDPEHVPALLELAWYCYAVEDDPHQALPLFEEALELSRKQLTEATRGRSGCIDELRS